jgi:hypothetical protein
VIRFTRELETMLFEEEAKFVGLGRDDEEIPSQFTVWDKERVISTLNYAYKICVAFDPDIITGAAYAIEYNLVKENKEYRVSVAKSPDYHVTPKIFHVLDLADICNIRTLLGVCYVVDEGHRGYEPIYERYVREQLKLNGILDDAVKDSREITKRRKRHGRNGN